MLTSGSSWTSTGPACESPAPPLIYLLYNDNHPIYNFPKMGPCQACCPAESLKSRRYLQELLMPHRLVPPTAQCSRFVRQLHLPLYRYEWEDLAQQPDEDNKDFKQRMKEVGLHLFTARSALPGTEVLQQVLQISEVEAAAIIRASGWTSETGLSGVAAAEATRMQDLAVRSALSAECDGPEDADYNYPSESDEEYEEGGAEEHEAAAEPEQEGEQDEEVLQKEVLLMQPLPQGFEVRVNLERRTDCTQLRTFFTAQCARHAVTKRLLCPSHLRSFLDEHGPHMCAPHTLCFWNCSACFGCALKLLCTAQTRVSVPCPLTRLLQLKCSDADLLVVTLKIHLVAWTVTC